MDIKKVKLFFYASLLLTCLNLALVTITFVPNSYAAVAGMGYKELAKDRDFIRAVGLVVGFCSVKGESINCM